MRLFHPESWRRVAALLLFALALAGLSLAPHAVAAQDDITYTDQYDARIAQDWMQLLYDRIEAEGISAPAASRLYAYAGVTLYEAVLNGMPDNNSFAGQIDHMPDMPLPDFDRAYDWPAVANEALAGVYHSLFEDTGSPETHDAIDFLHDKYLIARRAEAGEAIATRSVAYGQEVAGAIIEWKATDNYAETRTLTWEMPTGYAGYWTPTSQGQQAAEPYWGEIRPFGLEWVDECRIDMNVYYDEDPDSTFYAQALEVKNVGDDLTNEQKAIARWWLDTPGLTGTPAGHWVMIENQLVDQLSLPLDRAAEMYGMVGITLADSFISCWSAKYQYNLLRPVTYIQANIRRSWEPYIETPPFPEYPSGHSVVSAAAADILTSLLGPVAFTDTLHVPDGEAPRHFTSFEAAANEAAISRLYGGIHYRSAIENGMRQGRCIAGHLLDNIQLNPIAQGE
jgi:hypothetical protein